MVYGTVVMHSQYKTKRTRTGCLTCRDRHLKCDEETPDCLNCRKSRRVCSRGRRINFAHWLDVKPLQYTAKGEVRGGVYRFRDESRSIADQYQGGRDLYPPIDEDLVNDDDDSVASGSHADATTESRPSLSSTNQASDVMEPSPACTSSSSVPQYNFRSMYLTSCALDGKYPGAPGSTTYPSFEATTNSSYDVCGQSQQLTPADTQSTEDLYMAACQADIASLSGFESYAHSADLASQFYPSPALSRITSSSKSLGLDDRHEGLTDFEQAQHLKACIDRIAPWLGAFDRDNHFERIIAHRAVRCPTLLSALLAYDAAPSDERKARCHYYVATHRIKDTWKGYKMIGFIEDDYNLTDTTAALIILYAYRVTTGACHRGTSHISEAMEMLQLGQRDASSPGLGGACFWLFVVTDVMACLRMNRPVTLKPDAWGVDMTMDTNLTNGLGGGDEIWVHRIFYIMAKACDFRAKAPRADINDPLQRLGERQPDWRQLETLCLEWDRAIPGTMRPFAYVNKKSPDLKSCFPLIHFSSAAGTLGRLFYHMTLCILAQTNPRELLEPKETRARGRHHAQQICGIVATASSGARSCLSSEMVSCSLGIADLAIDNPDERHELARMMVSNHTVSRAA